MTVLFDSHAHLTDDRFKNDLQEVITRADEASVKYIITVADSLDESYKTIKLAQQYDNVYPTAGIHPHYAEKVTESDKVGLKTLLTDNPQVKALGEIGLDFYYGKDSKEAQVELFSWQLALAKEMGLPVIIHCRDAEDVILPIIERLGYFLGVFHCFSGDRVFCKKVVDIGFYVSFSGIITFKNAGPVREALDWAPLDRILVETDCPYLAPQKFRGKRNEPSFLLETANKMTEIKKCTLDELSKSVLKNTMNLFNIKVV